MRTVKETYRTNSNITCTKIHIIKAQEEKREKTSIYVKTVAENSSNWKGKDISKPEAQNPKQDQLRTTTKHIAIIMAN